MSRQSQDIIREGIVWNGFDYALQVWVLDGVIQPCGHPGKPCCNAGRYYGLKLKDVPGHEIRKEI